MNFNIFSDWLKKPILNQTNLHMKSSFYLLILLILSSCTTAQLNQALNDASGVLQGGTQLSTTDVANGLKEALVNGISKGSDKAAQTNGYFNNTKLKIPFPPDVVKVETKLRQLGMNKMVDDFVLSLNRGAELAAKEAKPIFVDAIKSMSISDAWGILKGEKNSATVYLKDNTNAQLYTKFQPVISSALNKVNATKYYSDIVNTYNKIPFVDKVNPDLNDYATNKAIDGLFILVEEEERNIRQDPIARTTDLLKRVFSQQDN